MTDGLLCRAAAGILALACSLEGPAQEGGAGQTPASGGLAPLPLVLPKPKFQGTPKNVPPGTTVPKSAGEYKLRAAFLAPPGTRNVALNKAVNLSMEDPISGRAGLLTDGDKEAVEGACVVLNPGLQHVQVDLGAPAEIYAVVFWLNHGDPRVFHDVIVQVADDADFIGGVKTLYSNDHDNSSGLGIGQETEYFETFEGKLVDAKGVKTRYVRVYTNGNTADELNYFTEVEVYGRPAQ
jgi:hypothetical protein